MSRKGLGVEEPACDTIWWFYRLHPVQAPVYELLYRPRAGRKVSQIKLLRKIISLEFIKHSTHYCLNFGGQSTKTKLAALLSLGISRGWWGGGGMWPLNWMVWYLQKLRGWMIKLADCCLEILYFWCVWLEILSNLIVQRIFSFNDLNLPLKTKECCRIS